jgi:prolyl oligopeptidase
MKVLRTIAVLSLPVVCSMHILADDQVDSRTHTIVPPATDRAHSEARKTVKSPAPGPGGDPRAWLEDPRGARALEWVRSQNARTLAVLKADPRFSGYYAAALRAANDDGALAGSTFHTGRIVNGWIHGLLKDDAHPLGLWRRATLESFLSADPQWDVLLDLDQLSAAEGRRWDFRFGGLECLPAGRERCLVWLADGGRLEGVYREFDLGTRSFVADGFNLREAFSRAVWWDEDTIILCTDALKREDSKDGTGRLSTSEYPTDVRMWKRGQSLATANIIFQGGPQTASAWPDRYADAGGERVVVVSTNDWEGRMGAWLADAKGSLQPMTLPPSRLQMTLHRGHFVVGLREPWTVAGRMFPAGALISVSLRNITEAAPTVLVLKVPEPREAVYDVWSTQSGVLVSSSYNVNGRLESFQLDKGRWQRRAIALPDHGTIRVSMADTRSETAFVTYQDFLQPITLYVADAAAASVRPLRSEGAPLDGRRFVTEQFEAVSSDGTKIPYFVVRARDLRHDGSSPTLMNGYGGFGLPQYPRYSGVVSRLWIEQGGTYVLANIRGGSELGPAWHQAAIKANRQRVYDDFIAVAEDLVRRKITSPRRLGIEGMSNGGLLVGVMLDQRPELFHAAVAKVPVLDLLRWDLLRGGAYSANEYGSLEISEERAFLERTSPYQNLRARPGFPVPLLMAATDDDNVHPAQARKYVAKAQELGMPVFYYESEEGGHGASITPAGRAQNDAVEFVYLARALMD